MDDGEEWTEWRLHDGKGCPCVGLFVHMVFDQVGYLPDGTFGSELKAKATGGRGWFWGSGPQFGRIIRYRLRKPPALLQLREMIETLPAPEREDA